MERRSFLRSLVGGVAVAAAVRTFPFRVFSFPSEIQLRRPILWGDLNQFYQPIYNIYDIAMATHVPKQQLFRLEGM